MTQTITRAAGFFLLFFALAGPVWAQDSTRAAPQPGIAQLKFLVLGFYENTTLSPELRDAVAKDILDRNLGVVLRPELSPEDLQCFRASCLEDLAKRQSGADYIIGGAILPNPRDTTYEVQSWIYKIDATDEEKRNQTRQSSKLAECKADDRHKCVKRITAELISERQSREQQETWRREAEEEKRKHRTPCSRWNFARAATLGAASGVMLAGLGTGIAAEALRDAAVNVTIMDNPSPVPLTDLHQVEFATAGFISTAVAAVPLALSLFYPKMFFGDGLPPSNSLCPGQPSGGWTTARGAAVGTFAGLLLFSVPLAIVLSTNRCSNCGDTDVNAYKNLIAPAWSISGAWAVGLTLSMVIPNIGGGQ